MIKKVLKKWWFWGIIICIGIWFSPLFFMSWTEFVDASLKLGETFSWDGIVTAFVSACIVMVPIMGLLFLVTRRDKKKNGEFRENLKAGDVVDFYTSSHSRVYEDCEVIEANDKFTYLKVKVYKSQIHKPKEKDGTK